MPAWRHAWRAAAIRVAVPSGFNASTRPSSRHTMTTGRRAAARAFRSGAASNHRPSALISAISTRHACTASAPPDKASRTAGVHWRCQT
ncbi:hypothetical protein G6F35_017663 [Rhizopus arrhizus]|nr:hypothetical protein G6F35_017663 [Rhizopus arrhizus]